MNRKPSVHAVTFAIEIMWLFQERSDHRVKPNIDNFYQKIPTSSNQILNSFRTKLDQASRYL